MSSNHPRDLTDKEKLAFPLVCELIGEIREIKKTIEALHNRVIWAEYRMQEILNNHNL